MTLQSEIIKGLLEKFPNATTRAIARMAYDDNAGVFTTVDAARQLTRYYRGANGKHNRGSLKDKRFTRDYDPDRVNPFKLPESDESEYLPYILPDDCKRVLCLYDIHFPYHDVPALTAALNYGKLKKADTIFIGGDALDFYALSSFDRDPRKRGFKDELDMMKLFFETLRREFPDSRIIYLLGNHEERYERYMLVKAPELLGVQEFKLKALLKCDDYGVEIVDKKRVCKLGKLSLIHGHEFGHQFTSPVNPARGLYMKAKRSTLCGHHHQTSEHSESDINGDVVTTWSLGCLCYLHPEYRPLNKWNHGFAFITLKDGGYKVHNKRIIDGEIV